MKMAEFSHTEAGSGLDMLAATEETPRAELRPRYFQHALDELEHARLFRERAQILAQARGGRSRADAVLDDGGYQVAHGIRSDRSLLAELGELEFLAFVWVHERRGAEQFQIYADLLADDAATTAMFARIARDERFHIAYSRAELDRSSARGAVRMAVLRVRGRRFLQLWLRLSRDIGTAVAGVWLTLLYVCVLGPFALVARRTEQRAAGIVPSNVAPAAGRAREMA
jgi:hypothetical protein